MSADRIAEATARAGGPEAPPPMIAEGLRSAAAGALRAASEEDWNAVTEQLIAQAREIEGEGRLGFYDLQRQRYAEANPVREAGEFQIGDYGGEGGSLGQGGEFKVTPRGALMRSEVVVYIPAAGHRGAAGIARGSAIVGRPDARREDVRICYEGAVYEQNEMRTLADRAVYACGRMVDGYPTSAAMSVPRESLVAVGTSIPPRARSSSLAISRRPWLPSGSQCPGSILPSFGLDWSIRSR